MTTSNSAASRNAIVIDVDRQSWSGRGGGTILLEGVEIQGTVVPGATYNIVVTGPAVSTNDMNVILEQFAEDKDSVPYDTTSEIFRDRTLFDVLPYAFQVFPFQATTVTPDPEDPEEPGEPGEEPGDPEDPIGPPALLNPDSENVYTLEPGVVFPQFGEGALFRLTQANEGDATDTGYIMMTALGSLLGINSSWNPDTATGYFYGYNDRNEFVEVWVQEGAFTFDKSINNGPVMSSAMQAGVGPVSMKLLDGRFYAPVAALRDMFGISVEWSPALGVVMIN